jgi:hypothetical protein
MLAVVVADVEGESEYQFERHITVIVVNQAITLIEN